MAGKRRGLPAACGPQGSGKFRAAGRTIRLGTAPGRTMVRPGRRLVRSQGGTLGMTRRQRKAAA